MYIYNIYYATYKLSTRKWNNEIEDILMYLTVKVSLLKPMSISSSKELLFQ